jgi:penicillin-binding protein 2
MKHQKEDLTQRHRGTEAQRGMSLRLHLSASLRYALLCCIVLIGLPACESILPSASGGEAPAAIQLLPQTPQQVAESFLDAWSAKDYVGMYSLIAPQSQQLNTQEVFATTYQNDDGVVGTNGVSYTFTDTEQQGTTFVITYDLTLQSDIYGEIVDAGRVMRLVETPNGWRVAWSRMDIFDGLASGVTLETVTDRSPRGNIYDRNGELLVEEGGTVQTVTILRTNFPDEQACLDTLTRVFRIEYQQLQALFEFYGDGFEFPIGDLDPDVFAANEGEMIANCAINSFPRETRRYVGHGAMAHITGAIAQIQQDELELWRSRGYDSDDLVGRDGIERQFEEVLAGEPERILRIREPGGAIVREIARVGGREPQDVTLTIDRNIQLVTAQAMADAYNYAAPNWAGRSGGGGAIVLEVDSGAVLAMVSYPSYDPGIFNPDTPFFLVGDYILSLQSSPRRPFFNRVIQEQYPPGSTFKIITTAAALAENIVRPDENFYCDLYWDGTSVGDTVPERTDWRLLEPEERRIPTGDVTPDLALAASCNPFYYQMGALLYRRGPTTLMDYARRMGLGAATGFDLTLPREVGGQIPPIRATDEAISSAIGQANVQVTMLQMARMVAGVANGGDLYRPHIVQQVGDAEPTQPQVMSEMGISSAVLDVVRQGMCSVTTNTTYGTAWFVFGDPNNNIPSTPYIPCGKTGTAQTALEPHGWFVAYAPADDPQIAIAIMIENSREGSETAAPIVRRILDNYFTVAPELVAGFPTWWTGEYVPLTIPEGSTGG